MYGRFLIFYLEYFSTQVCPPSPWLTTLFSKIYQNIIDFLGYYGNPAMGGNCYHQCQAKSVIENEMAGYIGCATGKKFFNNMTNVF